MTQTQVTISPGAKTDIVEGLTQGLAETAVETVKAQNFHWNVTGMSFGSLHDLFQEIYEDHFKAQDELAERVKALGGHAEGRMGEWLKRSSVQESDGHLTAQDMVSALKADQETLASTMRALAEVAEQHGDMLTNDLAIERGRQHEKFAWMLGAHLS